LACEKCHDAIQRDDREALLGRVKLAPVPRTLPDRYAPRYREQARKLQEGFWSARSGPAIPIDHGFSREGKAIWGSNFPQ